MCSRRGEEQDLLLSSLGENGSNGCDIWKMAEGRSSILVSRLGGTKSANKPSTSNRVIRQYNVSFFPPSLARFVKVFGLIGYRERHRPVNDGA